MAEISLLVDRLRPPHVGERGVSGGAIMPLTLQQSRRYSLVETGLALVETEATNCDELMVSINIDQLIDETLWLANGLMFQKPPSPGRSPGK